MRKLSSIISLIALTVSIATAAQSAKTYTLSISVTPPEGAEYTLIDSDFFFGEGWTLDGQQIRPNWAFMMADPDSPDFGYQWGFPLDYGENILPYGENASTTLTLTAENFPLTIIRHAAENEDGDYSSDIKPGGILTRGEFIKFDENNSITLTEPADYTIVGYTDYDLCSAPIYFTTDTDAEYSIGDGPRKPVTVGKTASDEIFPGSEVRIYSTQGAGFSSILLTDQKSGQRWAFGKRDEGYYESTVGQFDNTDGSYSFKVNIEGERINVTLNPSIADVVKYSRLDIVGSKYHGDNSFSIPKSATLKLRCTSDYIITEVSDAATGQPLPFDKTTYTVEGIYNGITINVEMQAVKRDKKLVFGFYNVPAMDGEVDIVLAPGTPRETIYGLDCSSATLRQISVSDYDLPIEIRNATFTHNKTQYQSTVFLNNVEVLYNAETGKHQWPDEIPSGSVIRLVNAVTPNYAKARTVKFTVEEGVSATLKFDNRELPVANGQSISLPVGTYINYTANASSPYAYAVDYYVRSFGSGLINEKQGFRVESGYKDITISIEKANKRNLIVYVDEDAAAQPTTAITLSSGKATEKSLALEKGYQTITLATEDLPVALTMAGENAAVFFNNQPVAASNGTYALADSLLEGGVLKIYATEGAAEVPTAEVDYACAELTDYNVVITHDNSPRPVDATKHHQLLPGTEIRFTLTPKNAAAPNAFQPMASTTGVTVKVNGTAIDPEDDGSYLVKINDDHIARGLNIRVEPLTPAALDTIEAEPLPIMPVTIYNLNGQRLPSTNPSSLPPGLYIINSKKLQIK